MRPARELGTRGMVQVWVAWQFPSAFVPCCVFPLIVPLPFFFFLIELPLVVCVGDGLSSRGEEPRKKERERERKAK